MEATVIRMMEDITGSRGMFHSVVGDLDTSPYKILERRMKDAFEHCLYLLDTNLNVIEKRL